VTALTLASMGNVTLTQGGQMQKQPLSLLPPFLQQHFANVIATLRYLTYLSKCNDRCIMELDSVTHQIVVPVPSVSCCVLNYHNLFYQRHNAVAFNWDMCCHLALCLWLLPFR
jgi:hypothetical protein